MPRRFTGALLCSLAFGAAAAAPLSADPDPVELCAPFSSPGSGVFVDCTLQLLEGVTYVIYSACDSISGALQLVVRDPDGEIIGLNDGYPFCPGGVTGEALVEVKVACGAYATATTRHVLQQGCVDGSGGCGGRVLVEHSSKEKPEQCPKRFACVEGNDPAVCAALGELYRSTAPDGWHNTSGWAAAAAGVPSDFCQFNGTVCDAKGELVGLALRGAGLAGTLPASLGSACAVFGIAVHVADISLHCSADDADILQPGREPDCGHCACGAWLSHSPDAALAGGQCADRHHPRTGGALSRQQSSVRLQRHDWHAANLAGQHDIADVAGPGCGKLVQRHHSRRAGRTETAHHALLGRPFSQRHRSSLGGQPDAPRDAGVGSQLP